MCQATGHMERDCFLLHPPSLPTASILKGHAVTHASSQPDVPSSYRYNLEQNHAQEYRALEPEVSDHHPGSSSASALKMMSKQLAFGGMLTKSTLFLSESVKHKLLVNTTANFICQELQPLSVVDESAFSVCWR